MRSRNHNNPKKHISVDSATTQIEKAKTATEATKPKPKQKAEPNRNITKYRPAEPGPPFHIRFIEDNYYNPQNYLKFATTTIGTGRRGLSALQNQPRG